MMLLFTIVSLALLSGAVANNCRVSDFKGVWAISDNGRFNLSRSIVITPITPPPNVALLVGRVSFDANGKVQNPSWMKTFDQGALTTYTSIKGNLTTTSSCQVIIKLTLVDNEGPGVTKYLQYEGYVQAGKQVLEMYSISSYRITRAQLSKAPNGCGKFLPFTSLVGSDLVLNGLNLVAYAFQLACTVPKNTTCKFTVGADETLLAPQTVPISYALSSNCVFYNASTSGGLAIVGSVHKFGVYYLSFQNTFGLMFRSLPGQV